MTAISDTIKRLHAELDPQGVELVAVSKFHPSDMIREAYDAGQRVFGESRVQELTAKAAALPADIDWHFIGHLQTNKTRHVVGTASMIESIDSLRLLDLVDRIAAEKGVVQRVLMQVHVAREETKTGFSPEEVLDYFAERRFESLRATHICGIMAMASNTDDEARVSADFAQAAAIFNRIKASTPDLRGFDRLSMGMTHDYRLAIAQGSNMVRIGSMIFGER